MNECSDCELFPKMIQYICSELLYIFGCIETVPVDAGAVFILFDFPTISAVLAYGNSFVKGFAPVYI